MARFVTPDSSTHRLLTQAHTSSYAPNAMRSGSRLSLGALEARGSSAASLHAQLHNARLLRDQSKRELDAIYDLDQYMNRRQTLAAVDATDSHAELLLPNTSRQRHEPTSDSAQHVVVAALLDDPSFISNFVAGESSSGFLTERVTRKERARITQAGAQVPLRHRSSAFAPVPPTSSASSVGASLTARAAPFATASDAHVRSSSVFHSPTQTEREHAALREAAHVAHRPTHVPVRPLIPLAGAPLVGTSGPSTSAAVHTRRRRATTQRPQQFQPATPLLPALSLTGVGEGTTMHLQLFKLQAAAHANSRRSQAQSRSRSRKSPSPTGSLHMSAFDDMTRHIHDLQLHRHQSTQGDRSSEQKEPASSHFARDATSTKFNRLLASDAANFANVLRAEYERTYSNSGLLSPMAQIKILPTGKKILLHTPRNPTPRRTSTLQVPSPLPSRTPRERTHSVSSVPSPRQQHHHQHRRYSSTVASSSSSRQGNTPSPDRPPSTTHESYYTLATRQLSLHGGPSLSLDTAAPHAQVASLPTPSLRDDQPSPVYALAQRDTDTSEDEETVREQMAAREREKVRQARLSAANLKRRPTHLSLSPSSSSSSLISILAPGALTPASSDSGSQFAPSSRNPRGAHSNKAGLVGKSSVKGAAEPSRPSKMQSQRPTYPTSASDVGSLSTAASSPALHTGTDDTDSVRTLPHVRVQVYAPEVAFVDELTILPIPNHATGFASFAAAHAKRSNPHAAPDPTESWASALKARGGFLSRDDNRLLRDLHIARATPWVAEHNHAARVESHAREFATHVSETLDHTWKTTLLRRIDVLDDSAQAAHAIRDTTSKFEATLEESRAQTKREIDAMHEEHRAEFAQLEVEHAAAVQAEADAAAAMHARRLLEANAELAEEDQRLLDADDADRAAFERAQLAAMRARQEVEAERRAAEAARLRAERDRLRQLELEAEQARLLELARLEELARIAAWDSKRQTARRGILTMRVIRCDGLLAMPDTSREEYRFGFQLRFNAANLPSSQAIYTPFFRTDAFDQGAIFNQELKFEVSNAALQKMAIIIEVVPTAQIDDKKNRDIATLNHHYSTASTSGKILTPLHDARSGKSAHDTAKALHALKESYTGDPKQRDPSDPTFKGAQVAQNLGIAAQYPHTKYAGHLVVPVLGIRNQEGGILRSEFVIDATKTHPRAVLALEFRLRPIFVQTKGGGGQQVLESMEHIEMELNSEWDPYERVWSRAWKMIEPDSDNESDTDAGATPATAALTSNNSVVSLHGAVDASATNAIEVDPRLASPLSLAAPSDEILPSRMKRRSPRKSPRGLSDLGLTRSVSLSGDTDTDTDADDDRLDSPGAWRSFSHSHSAAHLRPEKGTTDSEDEEWAAAHGSSVVAAAFTQPPTDGRTMVVSSGLQSSSRAVSPPLLSSLGLLASSQLRSPMIDKTDGSRGGFVVAAEVEMGSSGIASTGETTTHPAPSADLAAFLHAFMEAKDDAHANDL